MVDALVGDKVRQRRRELGMTPGQLAASLGVSAQQLVDYEHGAVRISAAMLARLCGVLQTRVAYFFREVDPTPGGRWPANDPG